MSRYCVFHRTWWKRNPDWPDHREPCSGKRHFICWAETPEQARAICQRWNASHDSGRLSDKAEWEAVG
jgi:hypothetical protein